MFLNFRSWYRSRKENRFLLTVFSILLLLSSGAFFLSQRTQAASSQELTNRLLLFVLWYLDVSLILVLSFIIVRSLIKLLLERRAGILGARFRTKLILTYIVLIFVPVIFIFLIATNLLQHSIDRWFSSPVENILRAGGTSQSSFGRRLKSDWNVRRPSQPQSWKKGHETPLWPTFSG